MVKADEEKLLKESIKEGKVVLGAERVIKLLKKGQLKKIYISGNCSADATSEIGHYSKLNNVPVVRLSRSNNELGVLCKKPFSVSVLGVR